MYRPKRTRAASCAFSALFSKNFSVRVSTDQGHSLIYDSGPVSGSDARVIARPPNCIESVMVLDDTYLNSAIILQITARFFQFPNGRSQMKHTRYREGAWLT